MHTTDQVIHTTDRVMGTTHRVIPLQKLSILFVYIILYKKYTPEVYFLYSFL